MNKEVKQTVAEEYFSKFENFELTDVDIIKRPLSYSSLKHFQKSPKHFVEYRLGDRKSATPAMLLGSVVDLMLLEPEKAEELIKITPKFDRRTKAGKESYAKLEAERLENPKFIYIDEETAEKAELIKEGFFKNKFAAELLENRKNVQKTIKFINRETQLNMIAKIDFDSVVNGVLWLVDLKVTVDADPDLFARNLINMNYDLQVGVYLDAYKNRYFKFPEFCYITVESTAPYNCAVHYISGKEINKFKESYLNTLKAFTLCFNEKRWAEGYEFKLMQINKYHTLNLPGYYKSRY